MKNNYLINETFNEKDELPYLLFKTPENISKKVEKVEKIQLIRTSPDSVELKIYSKNGNYIYHYTNDRIILLDKLDIGKV